MSVVLSAKACEGTLTTKDYQHFIIEPSGITFQGAERAAGCLPGDHVFWNHNRTCCEFISSAPGGRGALIGILELASKTRYGLTSRGHPIYLFRPFNTAYPPFIVGSSQKDTARNMLCSVRFQSFIVGAGKFPRGEIEEYFGHIGNWVAERAALLAHFCPHKTAKLPKDWQEPVVALPTSATRIPIEFGFTFHIDPDGCKDVDDLLTIGPIEKDGSFQAVITITDVAAIIHPTDEIAKAAAKIGQTFYDKCGTVIRPMIPPQLSENILTLKKTQNGGNIKNGISLFLTIGLNSDKDYCIKKTALSLSSIKVFRIYSYTYNNFLDDFHKQYRDPLLSQTTILQKVLAKNLNRQTIVKDSLDTHDLIECAMIYYNWRVAHFLKDRGQLQGIFREQRAEAEAEAEAEAKKAHKFDIENYTRHAASYCLGGDVHASLGLDIYCHASSPIRRFADLWNQWMLHKELEKSVYELHEYPVENLVGKLNERYKAGRHFQRAISLIGALENGRREFDGTCLGWYEKSEGRWVGKFLIEDLGGIFKVYQTGSGCGDGSSQRPDPGTNVRLRLGVNFAEPVWKRRFILELI